MPSSTLHPPEHVAVSTPQAAVSRSTLRRRGRQIGWARPALIALLVLTAAAYLWDLSASGTANSFYAAAVQAGTKSWKAFFFGSLDSSSFITVDKPPASLWVMGLSGRIFGFSSLSMLVPQALEGVAAVALLYAAVKRWFGPGAGLLAGLMLAVTPVAALMFRFNNPDALLVCLLVAAAYCLVRALEGASTRWVIAVGTLIGFAFLAKMMQAFLVLPAFALGVPGGRADRAAPPRAAAARRCSGDRRQRRLVGGDRRAVAGGFASDDRRIADQQHLQPDHRLQRPRTDLRRQRPGGRRGRGELQRRDRPAAPVQRPDGRTGVVAAARRAAGPPRRPVDQPPGPADRPHPRGDAAVGRLARGQRDRVQLRQRRHPHLLHRRARPSDRGAGGDRRGRRCGEIVSGSARGRCWPPAS